MYDTLNFWLPNEVIKESGYLQRVPTLLNNAKETYKQDTGEIYFIPNINIKQTKMDLKKCI